MNRQWSRQPLAIGDRWLVYTVKERRDSKGKVVSSRLVSYPGLHEESIARLLVATLNNREGGTNGNA